MMPNNENEKDTSSLPTDVSRDASKLNHPKPASRPTTPKSAIKGSGRLRKEPLFPSRTDMPTPPKVADEPEKPRTPLFPSWHSEKAEKSDPEPPRTPLFPSWHNERPPTRPMETAKPSEPLFPSRSPSMNPNRHSVDDSDVEKPKTPLFPSSNSKPRSSGDDSDIPDKPLFPSTGGFRQSKTQSHDPISIFSGFTMMDNPTPPPVRKPEPPKPASRPKPETSKRDRPASIFDDFNFIKPKSEPDSEPEPTSKVEAPEVQPEAPAVPKTPKAPKAAEAAPKTPKVDVTPEPEPTLPEQSAPPVPQAPLAPRPVSKPIMPTTPEVSEVPGTSDTTDTAGVAEPSVSATVEPELAKHEQASSLLGSFDFIKAPEPESQPEEPDEPPVPTVAAETPVAEAPEAEPAGTAGAAEVVESVEAPEDMETTGIGEELPTSSIWTDGFSSLKPISPLPPTITNFEEDDDFDYTPLFNELGAQVAASKAEPEPEPEPEPEEPEVSEESGVVKPIIIGHQADLKPSTNPFSAVVRQPLVPSEPEPEATQDPTLGVAETPESVAQVTPTVPAASTTPTTPTVPEVAEAPADPAAPEPSVQPEAAAPARIPTAATTPAPAVPEAPAAKPLKPKKPPVDVDKLKAELSEWGAWASMPQLGAKKSQDKKKSKVGGPSLVYRFPGDSQVLQEVDIAVVMESTYPFTAGDTAVSVQNIIRHNPDLTFGVIHIADDSNAPAKSMFELPANVKWVDVIYLESPEVSEKFSGLVSSPVTDEQVREVLDAIESSVTGNHELMHALYENAINPQTRTWSAWGALGHREFMNAAIKSAGKADDISLSQLFDLAYNFFLRIYTLLDRVLPTARVYHAHSSGNAGLVAAVGAMQNKGKFFLTEHNLNIRDSINKLLSRDLNRRVTREAPLKLTTDTFERFWTQWWLELGALNYAEAELITYLYPQAVTDAQELGGAQEKTEVLPDGIEWEDLEIPRIWRQQAVPKLERKISWKLAVVGDFQPSKGIIELIDAVKIMVDGGKTDVRVDLLKPADGSTTDEPEYYSRCVAHIKQLSVENYVRLRDVKDARDVMHEYDALVVPSFQESQPHAALVAMTMGVPIIGSSVGGMNALVTEELSDAQHKKIGASGELVPPGDSAALATLMAKLTQSPELYRAWHENALARIKAFYLLPQVMRRYNAIYRNLGAGKHKVIGGAAMAL